MKITKLVFDDWWTDTYGYRIEGLLTQEVEALIDFHWRELQATAIKHSFRETKEDMKEDYGPTEVCTCDSTLASLRNLHLKDCPLYQVTR